MQIIQTSSSEEARRCRLVQFGGKVRSLEIGGTFVTGIVHSIREIDLKNRPGWLVTFIPLEQANATLLGPSRGQPGELCGAAVAQKS